MDKKSKKIIAAIAAVLLLVMSFAEVPAAFAAGETGDETVVTENEDKALELQEVEGSEAALEEPAAPEQSTETPAEGEDDDPDEEDTADYEAVNKALEKAHAINQEQYTEESVAVLNAAIAAVVTDLPVSRQAEVDAMAKAITDAIAALKLKDAGEAVIEGTPLRVDGKYYYIRFFSTANKNEYYKNMEGKTKIKVDARWYMPNEVEEGGVKYIKDDSKDRAETAYNALVKKGWKFTYCIKTTNGTTGDLTDDEIIKDNMTYDQIGEKGKSKGYNLKVGNGKTYYLEVRATAPDGTEQVIRSLPRIIRILFPAAPSKVTVDCDDDDNRATVKWKKVKDAKAYAVYVSTNGKCPSKPTKKTKNTEYNTKYLAGPKTYTFFVKAIFHNNAKSTGGVGGDSKGTIDTVSAAAKDKLKIKDRLLGIGVRAIKWTAKVNYSGVLYSNSGCTSKKGTLSKGKKVYVTGKLPKKLPRGAHPTRFEVQYVKGGKTIKGWVKYGPVRHVSGEVAYKGGKAYDYSEAVKEDYVNDKKFSSGTKYLIWMNTYTQRVNIFTGKKGNWKLLRSDRCTSGLFYHSTGLGTGYKLHRRQAVRIRNFLNSTTKYYYKKLSYFSKGNSFHTPCWRLSNNAPVNHVKSNLQPGTQGCVRMNVGAAEYIYYKVPLGTKVITH